jgi:glycosyltransferase involved in cell wall biosynthesis
MGREIPGVREHVIISYWKNLYLSFIPRHIAIKKLVQKIKPDLIHAHFIAKYGFHLVGLHVHPSVVTAWGDDIIILPKKSRLVYGFTKKVLKSADLVYAVSHNISDRIGADFTIPTDKVQYLPFGIDTDLFTPLPDKKMVIGLRLKYSPTAAFFRYMIMKLSSEVLPALFREIAVFASPSKERVPMNKKSGISFPPLAFLGSFHSGKKRITAKSQKTTGMQIYLSPIHNQMEPRFRYWKRWQAGSPALQRTLGEFPNGSGTRKTDSSSPPVLQNNLPGRSFIWHRIHSSVQT